VLPSSSSSSSSAVVDNVIINNKVATNNRLDDLYMTLVKTRDAAFTTTTTSTTTTSATSTTAATTISSGHLNNKEASCATNDASIPLADGVSAPSMGIPIHRGVTYLSALPVSDDDVKLENSTTDLHIDTAASARSSIALSSSQHSLLQVSLFDKSDDVHNLAASHTIPFRRVCLNSGSGSGGEIPKVLISRIRSVSEHFFSTKDSFSDAYPSPSSSSSSQSSSSPQSRSMIIPKTTTSSIRINDPMYFSLNLKPKATHKVARLVIHEAAHLPSTKPSHPVPPSAYCTVYLIDSSGNKRSIDTIDARTEGESMLMMMMMMMFMIMMMMMMLLLLL